MSKVIPETIRAH